MTFDEDAVIVLGCGVEGTEPSAQLRSCRPNSYVPYQYLEDFFDPCEALENGTAFPELVSPYVPNQSQCIIKYLEGTKTCEEVDLDGN